MVLGLAVMLWVAGFDMIYACQDLEFDRRDAAAQRARPAAACPPRCGWPPAATWAWSLLLAALPLVYPGFGMDLPGRRGRPSPALVYEHWLVRPDDLRRVNRAFFHVNAVVSIGLLLVDRGSAGSLVETRG